MMVLEIELDANGEEVRVNGRSSREERASHSISAKWGIKALQGLTEKLSQAVRTGKKLDDSVIEDTQALYDEVFKDKLRDMLARLVEASGDQRLLVLLFPRDRALKDIPWETLCKPGTMEGFVGTDPKVLIARGVLSGEPWKPREIRSRVRVLAIAPGRGDFALAVLEQALAQSIEDGEVEWLEPIVGPTIGPSELFERLRHSKSPHIVHWLGHGGIDDAGKPTLRVADDGYGEAVWISAEAVGRELGSCFANDLSLIILEACEGAKTGMLGSAAEILINCAGADAAVAHLWPVNTDVARICSSTIYRSLTTPGPNQGDIGASVAAARRTLLVQSAEAFSPILYVRGPASTIFTFEGQHNRVSVNPSHEKVSTLPNGLARLRRYYNGTEHFYTISDEHPEKFGYVEETSPGYIFAHQAPGTEPFFRYYNDTDHFYAFYEEIGEGAYNWKKDRIAGYVYRHFQPNTIPLYRYWNGTDHFYTSDYSELGEGRLGYVKERIVCFIVPADIAEKT